MTEKVQSLSSKLMIKKIEVEELDEVKHHLL